MDRVKDEKLTEESEINSVQQRNSTRVRTRHMTGEGVRIQGNRGKEVKQEGEGVCVEGVIMGRKTVGGQ